MAQTAADTTTASTGPDAADRAVKQDRLAAVRAAHDGAPLVLTSHEALAWYLDGARTHVSLAGPPVLAVRVDDDGDTLFVAANEVDRLVAEELLPADAARIVPVPWTDPVADAARGGSGTAPPATHTAIGAATRGRGILTEADVAADLRAARASLLPAEAARFRALARETAAALTDTLTAAHPQQTERALAADLAARLVAAGIDPVVILVAGEGRLPHRHPLPTDAPLGRRAMLVACGRRHGLIANVTRWVGDAGADDARILEVEAAYLDAAVPGTALRDVLAAGTAAYAAVGFDADEWQRHHQGGAAGYAGRDPRATPATGDLVQPNQAFAWNPTAPGAKVEDTVLLGDAGFEVLTHDERWPTVEVAGRARPVALPYA